MKILHFVNGRCNFESANGVEKTICYMARYQAKQGHHVTVLNLTDKSVIEIGDDVQVLNQKPLCRGWLLSLETKRTIEDLKPEVIHLHSAYVPSNAAVGRLARSLGIPYAITPNGNLSSKLLKRRSWQKKPYRYLFELPLQNKAIFVHAINDIEEIRAYGVTSKIISAPNGMELDEKPKPNDVFIEKFPAFHDKRRILFLGRLDVEQKGLDLLIESYARLNDESSILILAGTSWKDGRERLQALAEKLGIDQRIIFYGGVFGEEKRSLLRHADYFIHTSRWEAGIPFSVLEGLAAGLPSLATPGADPTGLISASKAGINVEQSIESIESGLRELLDLDTKTLEENSIAALNLVRSNFSWEKIVATISEGYSKNCNSSRLLETNK